MAPVMTRPNAANRSVGPRRHRHPPHHPLAVRAAPDTPVYKPLQS